MVSVTFSVKKKQDEECLEYYRSRRTDDMFIQVFALGFDVLSTLSHDEAVDLLERTRVFAPCLDDFAVKDDSFREQAPVSVASHQINRREASVGDLDPTIPSTMSHSGRTAIRGLTDVEEQPNHSLLLETDMDERKVDGVSNNQTQPLDDHDSLDNLDDGADNSTQSDNYVPNSFDFALLLNQAAERDGTGLTLEDPATNTVNDITALYARSTAVGTSAQSRSIPVPSDSTTLGYNALYLNLHSKGAEADGVEIRRHITTENQQAIPKTAPRSPDSPKWSDFIVSTPTSPCDVPPGPVSQEPNEMEIDGAAGSPADSGRSWNESTPAPETPFLSPTNSYPTPGSNPPATPIPEKERIDYPVNLSPGKTGAPGVYLPCSPASPTYVSASADIGNVPNALKSASTGRNQGVLANSSRLYPDVEHDIDPMYTFATEDELGDEEMESILEDVDQFLRSSTDMPNMTLETEPKIPARVGESSGDPQPEDGYVTDSAVSHATVSELALASASSASSPANVLSPVSRQANDDVGSGHSKNRKRKRTADVDDPTARNASHNATSPYDSIQAAASQSSLLADEDLVVSDDLSSLSSTPGSPLLEPADLSATQEPSPLDVIFSRLTERERSQVRNTGDHLLMPDFPKFLERHSQRWFASGFWSGATWNLNQTSSMNSSPDRAGLINYLVTLQNEDEMQYLRLLVSRVLLFLMHEREIESERRKGTAGTALKQTATNNLCQTSGLSGLEKRRKKKSFHNNKRIGEYWWWCVRFFGPSFLLRCSRVAAKKINNTHFSLDALIAYVLNDQPHIVKPYPALDAAVVHLLTTGQFPHAFTRQSVQTWENCAATASQQTAPLQVWQAFSTEAVSGVAQGHLQEWMHMPGNRLLGL